MIEINNRKYILIERGKIMGLFSGIKRQLLKVIQWKDDTTDTIVYRYPMEDRDEIMNGCQLIVTESQCAMLVSGGQICDVYGPGTHSLTTSNMPIITKLASWKYGFDSPFKADPPVHSHINANFFVAALCVIKNSFFVFLIQALTTI